MNICQFQGEARGVGENLGSEPQKPLKRVISKQIAAEFLDRLRFPGVFGNLPLAELPPHAVSDRLPLPRPPHRTEIEPPTPLPFLSCRPNLGHRTG